MGLKEIWEKTKKNWQEQEAFNRELKEEVKKVKREEYLKQAKKSARERARKEAKRKFNPQAHNIMQDKLFTDLNHFGKQAKKEKKQKDAFHDLLWNS